MNKDDFLKKYNISEEEFAATGLAWDVLMDIYHDYLRKEKELKILANFIEDCLVDIPKVHSIKKRVKSPRHLISKLIRKKIEKPELDINIHNYMDIVTDLIGVRILHLFKEDWILIHDEILKKWHTKEIPIANVREGDNPTIINKFKEKGCDINVHHFGYRSIHYQILLLHNKQEITAEIQMRTLFEEAWSEIDHKIRYPHNTNDTILGEYLVIFNRLAGSADEMGSFIKMLKNEMDVKEKEIKEKNQLIMDLREQITNSKLEPEDKDKISRSLERLGLFDLNTREGNLFFDQSAFKEAAKMALVGAVMRVNKGAPSDLVRRLVDEELSKV